MGVEYCFTLISINDRLSTVSNSTSKLNFSKGKNNEWI